MTIAPHISEASRYKEMHRYRYTEELRYRKNKRLFVQSKSKEI